MIHTITEGGQLSTHSLRMLRQVFKVAFVITFLTWASLFCYAMYQLPPGVYQSAWYYAKATTSSAFLIQEIEVDSGFWWQLTGQKIRKMEPVPTERVIRHTQPYADYLEDAAWYYAKKTSLISLSVLAVVFFLFFLKGRLSSKKQHISGNQLSAAWRVALSLRLTGKASPIRIGNLSLLKGSETQHILITGGTGSGKTNCMHHILPQIRKLEHKAIIIDSSGAFLERYYDAEKDVILNPFDPRGAPWHPWAECTDVFDYDAIAESIISKQASEHDPYWNTAARSLLSSVLIKLQDSKKISDLNRWMLLEPLASLATFVKGTKAAAHIDLNSEKTAGSVRSVASSFVGSLEFLKDTNCPFSIREWLHSGKRGSWLFLACSPNQRTALNSLISCWFSIGMRGLLSLEQDLARRIWFVADELPTLQRIKDLEPFLCEGRKYGGCGLLAIQSPSQLDAIYGKEYSRTILGNCGTKIVFSEQDPEIAAKISRAFGEREIKEYQKGLSYGANDVRDGVSLTLHTKTQPLIPPSMIQFLEKNEAFVRLPGNIPITKVRLKIAR